jgi:hypothetical protein
MEAEASDLLSGFFRSVRARDRSPDP